MCGLPAHAGPLPLPLAGRDLLVVTRAAFAPWAKDADAPLNSYYNNHNSNTVAFHRRGRAGEPALPLPAAAARPLRQCTRDRAAWRGGAGRSQPAAAGPRPFVRTLVCRHGAIHRRGSTSWPGALPTLPTLPMPPCAQGPQLPALC